MSVCYKYYIYVIYIVHKFLFYIHNDLQNVKIYNNFTEHM